MARDGAGTYSLPEAAFVYDTVISETAMNSNLSDIATALTNSLARNGEAPPTANQPMATFKFTGLGTGSAATDSANFGQVQAEAYIWCGTAGGTADALTLTPSPAITAYAAGQRFRFKTGASPSTGAVTIAVSGLTTKAAQFNDAALSASITLEANKYYEAYYDGTAFQLTRLSYYVSTAGQALIDDADAASQRTTLGLAIGTDVQAYGATLTSLEALSLVSGDIIYATAADTLARLAAGTNGHVLTLAAGVPSWSSATVGYEFVATASASGTASVDIGAGLLTSGYDYYLHCENIQNSGDVTPADSPGVQFGTGAGPTYQTTGYFNDITQNGSAANETTARIAFTGGTTNLGGAAGEVWSGEMFLPNLGANVIHQCRDWCMGHFTDGSPLWWSGGGWRTTAEVVTGLRIIIGTGTITSGTFNLYRRKRS